MTPREKAQASQRRLNPGRNGAASILTLAERPETTVSYHIQEQATIADIDFPWETCPVGWRGLEYAREALVNRKANNPDDGKTTRYRIVKITQEVIEEPTP
jgi:hypothetical protein